MAKNKVKVTEIQPGMVLYQPEHKSGVLAAIKGYNESRGRKQGYRRPARPRRRSHSEAGRPGRVLGSRADKQTDMLFETRA